MYDVKKVLLSLLLVLTLASLSEAGNSEVQSWTSASVTTASLCWTNPTPKKEIASLVVFNYGSENLYISVGGDANTSGAYVESSGAMGWDNIITPKVCFITSTGTTTVTLWILYRN